MIAAVVLFVLLPPWWSEPVVGLFRFLDSNLNRGKTILINIQFLGTTYETPKESLPWYNTLVWTAFRDTGRASCCWQDWESGPLCGMAKRIDRCSCSPVTGCFC